VVLVSVGRRTRGEGSCQDSTLMMMKRVNKLYESICSVENLMLADHTARRGKQNSFGVMLHDRNREQNIGELNGLLLSKRFKTSAYDNFLLNCDNGKIREISRLPYFPDRIVHHAVMNVMEPIWMSVFTADTYSCIKGRGIHLAAKKIKKALDEDPNETIYCLKLDVRKFYPSIDHQILKNILRQKIKDKDLLWLLDEIIDSAPGVPIGNYLSQYFANLYLAYFDHWIKEEKGVKYYYRYCDDMVIFGKEKSELHALKVLIAEYLTTKLKLQVKDNWQVFPIAKRGVDFLGYRFWHTHALLRKSIKKSFAIKMAKSRGKPLERSFAAYWGWAKHCNSYNLIKKLTNEKVFGTGGENRGSNDREQNKHYANYESRNNGVGLQDRGQQVSKEQKREMLIPSG
jgi:retron-type reverse transcriptase